MTWAISSRLFFSVIFFSGFSALIYQLIWVRLLGLVFGVSSFAVATVVAVFLLGLGLGSFYFGKWSDRIKNPLRAYAFVELCIALFTVLSYLILNHLPLFKIAYEISYNSFGFYGISLIRILMSTIILLPPAFFIGGTIPLISKYFLTEPETLGSDFSRIYYMNTLGAFFGSIFTGFIFVKLIGVFFTFIIALSLNLIIATLIYIRKHESKPSNLDIPPNSPYSHMLIVLFITGLISIGYEILWVRILSTYDLSTSQSYALIVGGFLLGFSIGSHFISKKIDGNKNLNLIFGTICALTAISGVLVLFIFQRFDHIRDTINVNIELNNFTISLLLAFILSLIPAIFMGMLFPLGLKIYSHDTNSIGIKTGKVFLSNTLGCVVGSLLTGFLLIPFIGMWHTTLIFVNLSVIIAAFVIFKSNNLSTRGAISLVIIILICNSMVFSDKKTFHKAINGFDLIYYSEGLSGTVTAIQKGDYRGLFVDGQNVSGTDPALMADSKMLAHLPLLISENPRNALTVGYGTGATSYSMLLHDVEVDAVEIEEKIVEAGPLFGKVNFHSYDDPNLDIVFDDARSYIDAADEKFDVIVTDVTNLKYKRNPYLYTKEYFNIMKDSLSEKGIAAAWLPLAGLSFKDLKILVRTFDNVYEHTTIWFFTQYPTHFIILVGTPEKTELDLNKLKSKMQNVKLDLKRIQVDDEFELATMLLLGESDVDKLVSGEAVHTDNFPILEFSDMGDYMLVDLEPNLKSLLEYQKEDLSNYFTGTDEQIRRLIIQFKKYRRLYGNLIKRYERIQARMHGMQSPSS